MIKLDASTATRLNPVIFVNLERYGRFVNIRFSFPKRFRCVLQIKIPDITDPKTTVWPTIPGNLAAASGRNVVSDSSCDSNSERSTCASPTPKITAA